MPLTPQEIKEMDAIAGVTTPTPTSQNLTLEAGKKRASEVQQLAKNARATQSKAARTIPEKIADFTGGKKIGQGLGQMLAFKGNSKLLDESQKTQIDTQGKLMESIKKAKVEGRDTSRLEKALEILNEDIEAFGASAERVLNPNELTPKQVIGDALQLGTTVLGAGKIPGVAKSATAATGVIAGAKQGAIQGAKAGAIYGASSGASSALKEDKSGMDIAKGAVGGALVGAGTGGLIGGAIGGVSGGVRAAKAAKETKAHDFAADLVSPKQTEAVKIQALKEGRVTEQGLLQASKITPSKRDTQIAEAVKGVIDPKKSQTQNLNLLESKVDEINTGVKAYVKLHKVPFNTSQLRTQLNKGKKELNLVFASDTNAEKTYDAVVKEFLKRIKDKDTAGLLKVRQEFDSLPAIKKLLNSQGLGENTRKEVALTVRSQANKYVASLLPKGNKFRETLLKESKMIEAIQNIAEKNTGLVGANKLQSLTKKYPVLNWLAGGVGAGLVGGASIGVGRSIIGSSN